MIDHLDSIPRRTAANHDLVASAPTLVGRFAFDLASDQPSGLLPEELFDAVTAGLSAGQTHYVDVPGIGALRELLAEHVSRAGRAQVAADGLVVTAGVQEARFLTIQVLAETFGTLAVPDVLHPGARNALGVRHPRELLRLPTAPELGYLVPVAEIERALVAGARLLVLETPSRLTGASYGAADVARIAAAVAHHDAHVIVDDGFTPWSEAPVASLALEPAAAGRVTVIGEGLPGVGLEAWSLGFIATPKEHVAGFTKLKQIMSICTSTPTQLAAIEVLRRGLADLEARRAMLVGARRDAAAAAVATGRSVVPGSCLNVLAVTGGVPVGAADGAAFGAPGVARLRVDGPAAVVVLRSSAATAHGGAR